VLRTKLNPLARILYLRFQEKFVSRKGFAYLVAKRTRYCGSAEMLVQTDLEIIYE